MNNPSKSVSVGVTNASLRPADFPLGSAESRAAARAVLEGRQQREMCDVTVLIMTGLPNYFGPPVVTPPDAVAYYEAEDGSVLAEVHRHWEGDGGRHGATVFLDQAWPDGSSHLERGSAFVTSLDQLRRLPHAEQSMIEHMDEA